MRGKEDGVSVGIGRQGAKKMGEVDVEKENGFGERGMLVTI